MATPSIYQLSNKNGSDSVLTASRGSYILNNTVAYSGNARAIVVLQDTVFSTITHFGVLADVTAMYIAAPATAVKAGAIITPLDGNLFTSIKLVSGSVALVL
jgi:hypothetical protein